MRLSPWDEVSCTFVIPIRHWPLTKVKFIGFLSYFCVQPVTFVCFDIGLPYLAHASITMRGCVAHIHNPDMKLTFDLKVKFTGFITRFLCTGHSFFVLLHSHTMFGMLVYHNGTCTMCRVHSWIYMTLLWPQYQHYIFTMALSRARSSLFFYKGISSIRHMGLSPWDNMLCTFLTLVWLDLWVVTGVSFLRFTHSFYLVYRSIINF